MDDPLHEGPDGEWLALVRSLVHDLMGPLTTARMKATTALEQDMTADAMRTEMNDIRVLCARAAQVLFRFRYAWGDVRDPHKERLRPKQVLDLLSQAVAEAQPLARSSQALRFQIHQRDFEVLDDICIFADLELVKQAASNLLDNAAKYSYRDTTVEISAGVTTSGEFFISVSNSGLPITEEDARNCIGRGWRGREAQAVAGGSGLGLWIVNAIMHLHGGRVIAIPTDSAGRTEFKLVIPSEDSKV